MTARMLSDLQILDLRRRLGLTQDEFATKIGCTARSVGGWERGEHKPSQFALAELHRWRHFAGWRGAEKTQ